MSHADCIFCRIVAGDAPADRVHEDHLVVFLHRILPGGADRSYGIHVAELAGLPRPVINRAQEILAELEAESAQPREAGAGLTPVRQLALFHELDPMAEELRRLDVSSMTPLEALNLLYAWRQALERGSSSEH